MPIVRGTTNVGVLHPTPSQIVDYQFYVTDEWEWFSFLQFEGDDNSLRKDGPPLLKFRAGATGQVSQVST